MGWIEPLAVTPDDIFDRALRRTVSRVGDSIAVYQRLTVNVQDQYLGAEVVRGLDNRDAEFLQAFSILLDVSG
jgi:F420-0:gamma-glutamyl ligase